MTPEQLQAEVKRIIEKEWFNFASDDHATTLSIIRAQQALLVEARDKCCETRSELLEHGVADYELESFIDKLKAATGDM